MINFENVSCRVLREITFNVPKGEIVGLIGKSGAGKTTLIKAVCGLLSPNVGNVYVLGKDPVKFRHKYRERFSAFIAGIPLLCPEDNARQGFEIIRTIYGISKREFEKRYVALSKRLDFARYENKPVKNLSLGERMRAELSAAMICEPDLLVLDEPNIGLDENAKRVLGELLSERRVKGLTTLLTSHDMASVSEICTRIALMENGKLVFYGSRETLQSRFTPIDTMTLKIGGALPDFEDLPLKKYSVYGNIVVLSYNSNHVTAAEILKTVLRQTEISEVNIRKPDLESVIMQLKKR